MAVVNNATPLIALDAAVIDTETTGLDPAKARIVEIAAVRLVTGKVDTGDAFRRLVRPDEPIPHAVTRIHGIDDAAVADAPRFAEVWPEFSSYLGGSVLIGHSLGFDLAVLKRECERIGAGWRLYRSLDTRLLAQVAEPNLADFSLDGLAAWLNVEIAGRHSALGDATVAARIFCALVPKLRERGIRTLAEAKRASAALTMVVDRQRRAGWVEPAAVPVAAAAARIDSHPYLHRAGAIMSAPARFVDADAAIGAVLELMVPERLSSMFVRLAGAEGPPRPEQTGIVTERDLLRSLSTHGAAALAMPVGRVASRPLITVPADAFAYMAIGRMNRLKIRHLGVTGRAGDVIGGLSTRDLLQLRGEQAVELGDEIEHAKTFMSSGAAGPSCPELRGRCFVKVSRPATSPR